MVDAPDLNPTCIDHFVWGSIGLKTGLAFVAATQVKHRFVELPSSLPLVDGFFMHGGHPRFEPYAH